jgi:hypothetical protein
MSYAPKPAPRLWNWNCKIKPVNPAFRSVSTPRSTKDLPVVGPVNPTATFGRPSKLHLASESSAENLVERPRIDLAPAPTQRLVSAAERRGVALEQLFDCTLSEVA